MRQMSGYLIGLALLLAGQNAQAGAACVVVKKLGDSLAIEWVAGEGESVANAIEKAKARLREQGWHKKYQDAHPQANTNLPHAHAVIVQTDYKSAIGKPRTSYGCGYSAGSAAQAEQAALKDLRNYSWGWKPEFGYKVLKKFSY